MATTDKLGLSVTREIDHQTLSFGDWRYLQDGDDNNSNTKKIDDWAQLVDSTITSGCAAFISGGTLANESFLLLSENSSLPNAKIVLSGCGIELRQEAQEAHLMLNLEGDSVAYGGGILPVPDENYPHETTIHDFNRNFGVTFILGDGINPVSEGSFAITKAPYGFDITQYDIFLDAPHEVEAVLEIYNSGSSSWDYAMSLLTYGDRTYWEDTVSPPYGVLENDIMRIRCVTADGASLISITFSLTKDL